MIVRVGGERLVGGDAAGEQYDVAVAPTLGNGFQIYWTEAGTGGIDSNGSSIRGEIYSSDALPVSELLVNRTTAGDQSAAAVALLGDGKAAVAWTDASGTGNDPGLGIKAQRVSGTYLYYPEVAVNRSGTGDQADATVAAVTSGYVVAFADRNSGKVIAQAVDDYGRVGPSLAPYVGDAIADAPNIVALSSHAFIMVWRERASAASPDGVIRAQRFESAGYGGAAVGEIFNVSVGTTGMRSAPEVVVLADGRLAFTWTGIDVAGSEGVKVRLFEADGTAIGGEIAVNTVTAGRQHDSHFAVMAGGGFGVVWTNEAGTGGDVKIQLFDNGGVRFGAETLVSTSAVGNQWGASVANLSNGQTLIGWTEQLAGGTRDVKAQLFELPAAPVAPATAGDDVITGSTGADMIDGLVGNDIIRGSAGDDVIDGGAGEDQLFGNGGNDTVRGGADDDFLEDRTVGNDSLDGGDGDDRIVVIRTNDPAHDLVSITGGAGADEIVYQGSGTDLTIDAGSGDDLLRLTLHNVNAIVTLGTGVDTIRFEEALPDHFRTPTLRITDFVTGTGGDTIDLSDVLGDAPFQSGAAYLQQNGTDVELVRARGDDHPVDVVLATFAGHVVADFTSANFSGAALSTTLEITTANAVVTSDGMRIGLPAVRIAAEGARFVNLAGGNIAKRGETAADPATAAIILAGAGATVENHAGARIAAEDGSYQAILGSAAAEIVENDGEIVGRVVLAGGNDRYSELVGESNAFGSRHVDLGTGDDLATFDLSALPGLTNLSIDGGAGADRVQVTNIGVDETLRFNIFTGIETLDLVGAGPGSTVTLNNNGQTAADIVVSAGLTLVIPDSPFNSSAYTGPATGSVHLNGGTLRFGPNAAFAQIVGSDFAERVVLEPRLFQPGATPTGTGSVDLGGGNDSFVWNYPNTSPGSVAGGTGLDTLTVGQTFETQSLAAFSGFETIEHHLSNGYSGLTYTLTGLAADTTRLLLDIDVKPSTTLLDVGSREGLSVGAGGTGLTIAAGSTVARIADRGLIDPANPAATDQRIDNRGTVTGAVDLVGGNDALVNSGMIRGTVTLGAGNDSFTNAAGGVALGGVRGGIGDDLYVMDATFVPVELTGEGYDTVRASVSFSLKNQYIERLELTGTAAINATGNTLDNVLIGNAAANILNGHTGVDQMTGGNGDDVYLVDNVGDRVFELSGTGSGNDLVQSSVSFALTGQHVERLTLTGTAAINAKGNTLDNVLTGNAAANVLNGHTGADQMIGGDGNDTFIVDNVRDTVVEFSGTRSGDDLVQSSVSFALTGQYVERLTLAGSAAIDAKGNTLDNILIGNRAANTLNGHTGHDLLTGGAGADRFFFDSKLGGTNWDDLLDFSSADDTIVLDRAIFKAAGAAGVLADAAFRAGTAAADIDDRVIYDAASGNIYYDADGTGVAAQQLFAHVTIGTILGTADFLLI